MNRGLLCLWLLLQSLSLSAAEWVYTVRPGDNLWNLTERYLVGLRYWQPLKRLNQIAEPRRMLPGSQLRIPLSWSKVRYVDAQVVAVQGRVEVRSGTGAMQLATVGMRLQRGDQLLTSAGSSLLLEFSDGSELLLAADSTAELLRLEGYGDGEVGNNRVKVDSGRIESSANPRKIRGTRFEISTPSAITAVRGTGFRVAVDGTGRSRIEVVEGRVEVTSDAGRQPLSGGFGLVSAVGGAMERPVKLLPAPSVVGVPQRVEEVSFTFQLQPLARAQAYRLQVARSEQLSAVAFDSRFPDGKIRIDVPGLPDGNYVMKVRGVDGNGIEGIDAVNHFELNARPAAPFLITPVRDSASIAPQPAFAWAEPEAAAGYRFQLARDQQMNDLVLDLPHLTDTKYQPLPLKSGRYFWRVTAYDTAGKAGPEGLAQPFRVLPKAPDADIPEIDETGLNFHWRPGRPGQRYRFQMADTADFTNLLKEQETSESQVRLSRPAPGVYFMRVKSIDEDGSEGPYGSAQRVEIRSTEDHGWIVLIPLALMFLIAL